jgi:protein SCO1/2|tara:strand:- start:549 stop:1154 length:606 start_codon:yes stop_codon:yes gene_type:complete
MYVQKILILFIFLVSAVFSNVQEISAAGNSAGSQKPLRFYENRGGDFELTGPDGKELSSESFRGKVMLIFFGYTYCPDVCPMSLSHLKVGMLNLKEQAKDVQVLFISIDPERDTPEKLKEYVPYFYPTFLGLTGSVNDIAEVARQYGAGYFKQYVESVEGYFMAHTDAVFLVDQQGRYRGRYKTKWDMDKLVADIQWLLSN